MNLITAVTKNHIESYWPKGEMPGSITASIMSLKNELLDKDKYVDEIQALTMVQEFPGMSHQRTKYLFIYVVQLILTESSQLLNEVLDTAIEKVDKLFADHEEILSLDEDFHVKATSRPRVGNGTTKKEQAIEMRRQHWDESDPKGSSKRLMKMFQDELAMTVQGSRTYVYITRDALAAE